ncbi:MAG: LysR family transcriptional regulator [Clostridia bacterium]|nr:LysR family transcriptional regulator [Clostridia bacterium]
MEFLQLIYFCSAAETQSFAESGREFSVPAASISQSVKRLEKELGVTLFDRTANGVLLNERGQIFYNAAKSALTTLDNAKHKLDDAEYTGSVNLLVVTNRRLVNEAIRAFREKHKNVSFFIDHKAPEELEKYDLIITDNFRFRKDYVGESFIVDELLLAVSKSNPLSEKEKVFVSDLENEPFVTLDSGSGLYTLTRRICNRAHFMPKVAIQSDDPYYIAQYIDMGLGVGIVPSIAWQGMFSDNIILKRLEDDLRENTYRRTSIYYNSRKYMTKATKGFLEELRIISKRYKR